jgi:hypothetical protein
VPETAHKSDCNRPCAKRKDEHYVLELCDKILGMKSLRQHRFDFLTGDLDANGRQLNFPLTRTTQKSDW